MDVPHNHFGEVPEWEGEPEELHLPEPDSRKVTTFEIECRDVAEEQRHAQKWNCTADAFYDIVDRDETWYEVMQSAERLLAQNDD